MTLIAIAELFPPPGVGVRTEIRGATAASRSLARMVAVSFVELTKVVERLTPFTRTTDVGTKFVPVTVRVSAAPAAVAVVGLMLVSVGTGLLTLNAIAELVPPPGVGDIRRGDVCCCIRL